MNQEPILLIGHVSVAEINVQGTVHHLLLVDAHIAHPDQLNLVILIPTYPSSSTKLGIQDSHYQE